MTKTLVQAETTLRELADERHVQPPDEVLDRALGVSHELLDQLKSARATIQFYEAQLFGAKSEKLRVLTGDAAFQLSIAQADEGVAHGETGKPARAMAAPKRAVGTRPSKPEQDLEGQRFFDAHRVPMQTIEVPCPLIAGLAADQYERVGEKVSYRLAQRPGSYVVLAYVRPQYKLLENQRLVCAAAPAGVLAGSRADVSLLAGILVDKVAYHVPLYRVHQRMTDCGLKLSRQWLTELMGQTAALLEPIYQAQLQSIRNSRVIMMDETPIKAGLSDGRSKPGQVGANNMHQGYFWPVMGQDHEVCFVYASSREHHHAAQILGVVRERANTVLITDGYGAYEAYARQTGVKHARCWAHCRRYFFRLADDEPAARDAVERIAAIYHAEQRINQLCQTKARESQAAERLKLRGQIIAPMVQAFFDALHAVVRAGEHTVRSGLIRAIGYALKRRDGLELFLKDPEVPLDTNAIERSLRCIAIGRRNWLFCWTELGAKHIGIVQSLIATCRMHSIDPYAYFVDVLQRIDEHPASQVAQLTPVQWKTLFADKPMTSVVTAKS